MNHLIFIIAVVIAAFSISKWKWILLPQALKVASLMVLLVALAITAFFTSFAFFIIMTLWLLGITATGLYALILHF